MPIWFKIYLSIFALQAVFNPVLSFRNSFCGKRIFQKPFPRWLTPINCIGDFGFLYLMWAYWHPSIAAAIGSWCIPIFLVALAIEMFVVQKTSALTEAELEADSELSPYRGPLFWLTIVLGFICSAPAYAIGGLLCLQQLNDG